MGRLPRAEQFLHSEVAIVHCVQRCVRRAFLAGVDEKTGVDYSFRKEWIRRRLEALASVFGIDVLTYAIMSNHLHVILRNRPDVVAAWSDEEVAIRWLRVFPGRRLEEQLAEPTQSDVQMLVGQPERLATIRQRLSDISWFMRALSEPIARIANGQDQCSGHFWEGRFKALRIVDETGLLACSMYVDLNPIRAAMATDIDEAKHTSAYDRLRGLQGEQIPSAAFDLVPANNEQIGQENRQTPVDVLKKKRKAKRRNPTGKKIRRDTWLSPLTMDTKSLSSDPQVHQDGLRASNKGFLSLSWQDYFLLLSWTAKQKHSVASSEIPKPIAKILTSRGIDASMYRDFVWQFKKYFGKAVCVGLPESMSADAARIGKKFHRGQRAAKAFTIAA